MNQVTQVCPAIFTRSIGVISFQQYLFCSFLIRDSSQTEEREDDVHSGPARRAGEPVRQDSVPGYLHERGGGLKDQPAGIQSAGEPTLQHKHHKHTVF